jgi:transaldolase
MRVTTNPSIFEKAITERTEYDGAIERCVRRRDEPAASIYDAERAASGDRMKTMRRALCSQTPDIPLESLARWRG